MHPNRRHYTPSVQVQRHVTGAAPRNGCSASGPSPARQSTRGCDNAEELLKHAGNYRVQPQQRSRASHRPADGHHSCLSTSSMGERPQGIGQRRLAPALMASAAWRPPTERQGTNTPFEHSVASLGSVASRLAGRPPGPRPSHPTHSHRSTDQAGTRLSLTPVLPAPGPQPSPRPGRPSRGPSEPRHPKHRWTDRRAARWTELRRAHPTRPRR